MMSFLSLLTDSPGLLWAYAALLGLLVGSFLNVVALRLPPRLEWHWRREAKAFLGLPADAPDAPKPPGLVVERSHCPICAHRLTWWENLPVVSFVFLCGRCRNCRTHISWQYPVVEVLTGILFFTCVLAFGASWFAVAAAAFCALLVALAAIDARTQLLPDNLVFPLLWLGLGVAAAGLPGAVAPTQAIWGAVLGYGLLWSAYWLFKLVRGKEGMGHGDFKLLAALGAWCGPASILPIVLVSTLAGALVGGVALTIQGRDRATPFAFGPFLAAAGLVEFFWRGGIMGLLGVS